MKKYMQTDNIVCIYFSCKPRCLFLYATPFRCGFGSLVGDAPIQKQTEFVGNDAHLLVEVGLGRDGAFGIFHDCAEVPQGLTENLFFFLGVDDSVLFEFSLNQWGEFFHEVDDFRFHLFFLLFYIGFLLLIR